MKLYQAISQTLQALRNCQASGNAEWLAKHRERLASLVERHMPSGSGFDAGTTLDDDASDDTRLVFVTSFHHMNDVGMYDGWTEHRVTVKPTFGGIDVRVYGKDRNQIKDYIGEAFYAALNEERAQ